MALCILILSPDVIVRHALILILLFFHKSGPSLSLRSKWGVNYRALHDLFEISQSRRGSINYEVGVQMVEIYNEVVRDLLSSKGPQKRYPFPFFS